jgi:hypothetical protein
MDEMNAPRDRAPATAEDARDVAGTAVARDDARNATPSEDPGWPEGATPAAADEERRSSVRDADALPEFD